MNFIQKRQTVVLITVCTAVLATNLMASQWWKLVASGGVSTNYPDLLKLWTLLNLVAIGARFVCLATGIYLLVTLARRRTRNWHSVLAGVFVIVLPILLSPQNIIHIQDRFLKTQTAQDHRLSKLVGKYYMGDGLALNKHLELHPGQTYTCTWDECEGVHGQESGISMMDNGSMVLLPVDFPARGHRYLPVFWGERAYLIDMDEELDGVREFRKAILQGNEPRKQRTGHGFWYLQDGDWQRAATGLPVLPVP